MRTGTITTNWVRKWNIQTQSKNPHFKKRIPVALEHLRNFDTESAYVRQQGRTESLQAYKRRLYTTMLTIQRAGSGIQEMRLARRWPYAEWETVWKNLREAPASETTRVAWYKVVHDILPTNEHLHTINKTTTNTCRHCDDVDAIRHRLTACEERRSIWDWTKKRIAHMLQTVPDRIADEWLTHP